MALTFIWHEVFILTGTKLQSTDQCYGFEQTFKEISKYVLYTA